MTQPVENRTTRTTPKTTKNAVLSIAHRGASGTKPGNTLEAFEEAILQGADMIELDIQVCASGEVIVFHDVHLENGQYVNELSFEEILATVPTIPTIESVLDLVNARADIYFDLKCRKALQQIIPILHHVVESSNWSANQFLVASFDHYQLIEADGIRQNFPTLAGMKTVALTSSIPLGLTKSYEQLKISYVAIDYSIVTRAFVEDAHKRQLEVLIWTVNTTSVMKKMIDLKVDGVVTDYPHRVHAVADDVRNDEDQDTDTSSQDSSSSEEEEEEEREMRQKYTIGCAIEIQPHRAAVAEESWYSGVITKYDVEHDTYSILWWGEDNSQRTTVCVSTFELRLPRPNIVAKYRSISSSSSSTCCSDACSSLATPVLPVPMISSSSF